MKQLGSTQRMTSAYHPQANGQAERVNQTLKQYLRHYLNLQQDNWVELLPLAQYAYNSAISETTGNTPFEALYGKTPTLYGEPIPDSKKADGAIKWTEELKEAHRQLHEDLKFQRILMAKYFNKSRSSAPTLKEGEKVFLLRRNFKTKRPSDKLDHLKVGPFRVKRQSGKNHYELELPKGMRVHPIFHIALLEPAPANIPVQKALEIEPDHDEELYEFERIIDHRETPGIRKEYLVK